MTRALEGLKVLDFAWSIAGPLVGRAMADFGATVVRVESSKRPDFGRSFGPFPLGKPETHQGAVFDNYNAGKLGVALDLSRQEARVVAGELAAWADVIVESFSPGQMAKFGLDYQSVRTINPGVIMLSTSLLGQIGPYSKIAGFGSVGAALAGFQVLAGAPNEPPIGCYSAYTDAVAPRFSLVMLLAALDHRSRTGEGMWIDVAQSESAIHFLAPQVAHYADSGEVAQVQGNRDPSFAPHGVFATRGRLRWVAIAVRSDAEWVRFAQLIGQPELSSDPRFSTLEARKSNEDILEDILGQWTRDKLAEEVERLVQAQGIPAHVVAAPADIETDPQLTARGYFVRLPHPERGALVCEAARFSLSDTPAQYSTCAPDIGRHTDRVLREFLGYSTDRIASLRDAGALS